jgi:carbonic anhydrase
MKALMKLVLAPLGMLAVQTAQAQHWGYTGAAGPEHWSELESDYAMCGLGRNQSPIDLAGFLEADLKPLAFSYRAGAVDIVNNGHSVQISYAPGSMLSVDGHVFELKQFHFHAPSENRINGKSFPLEVHLVHEDQDGNLAVVAALYEDGAADPLLSKLWDAVPAEEGAKAALPAGLNVMGLLPSDRDYYRYNGSLTTPPCSEGVWWLVMKQQKTVSPEQVQRFANVLGFSNNRPIQPVNARVVAQ